LLISIFAFQLGPYTVFPNLALWDMNLDGWFGNPIVSPVFWVCLGCQLAIVVGYLWLFRKEQLSKP
jgi:alpha-1,3-glucan synthase